MPNEQNRKYIITAMSIVIVLIVAGIGFGIWRLSKQPNKKTVYQPLENALKSVSAPATTTKTTQELTAEEKKVIDSLSSPKTAATAIKKSILDSLTSPAQ